jgi:tRNA(fMet)-specific endonuclease VapC
VTIPANKLVLPDTNVLAHLLRNNATGKKIDTELALSTRPERPLLCSVVEGELLGVVEKLGWGPAKLAALHALLSQLVRVSSGEVEVVRAYAQLYANQRKKGLPIGENDLWIAATAKAVGAMVITCDSDFQKIDPSEVEYLYIAP